MFDSVLDIDIGAVWDLPLCDSSFSALDGWVMVYYVLINVALGRVKAEKRSRIACIGPRCGMLFVSVFPFGNVEHFVILCIPITLYFSMNEMKLDRSLLNWCVID